MEIKIIEAKIAAIQDKLNSLEQQLHDCDQTTREYMATVHQLLDMVIALAASTAAAGLQTNLKLRGIIEVEGLNPGAGQCN